MINPMYQNRALVSVIIPLYNRREAVLAAAKSALEQDYENIEVLVIDDGSLDNSLENLRESISDSRLRTFRQHNQGACAARNYGIELAHGKYVALLDSDDIFLPGHIRQSINAIESAASPCVVYGRIIVDRGGGKTFLKPPRGIRNDEEMSEYLLCDQGFIQTSTVVLTREMAMSVKYDPRLLFGQDTDFAIRLAYAGAKFVMLPTPQAIWSDQSVPGRVSSSLDPYARLKWLDRLNGMITPKARKGDEGWVVAKCFSKQGRRAKATYLYIKAVLSGCYKGRLAIRVALQIFLSPAVYRKMADITLRSALK